MAPPGGTEHRAQRLNQEYFAARPADTRWPAVNAPESHAPGRTNRPE